MSKIKNRLTYKASTREEPLVLVVLPKDRFRYNREKHFYTVMDTYHGWAIGLRRHASGYTVAVLSTHNFLTLDLEDYDYFIAFRGVLKYKGPMITAYNLIQEECKKSIDKLNRGFAYERENCVFALTVETNIEVANEKN